MLRTQQFDITVHFRSSAVYFWTCVAAEMKERAAQAQRRAIKRTPGRREREKLSLGRETKRVRLMIINSLQKRSSSFYCSHITLAAVDSLSHAIIVLEFLSHDHYDIM